MLQRHLRQHQWKAFRRNPMFERNLGVRIFMFIMFGFLALEFLMFGFLLDKVLLEMGRYPLAIDTFNSILLYLFAIDFTMKFFFKKNQSMQIAPYLTLPIKRNQLFNFLLRKEFTSFWNIYLLFLVIPFAFKAITPFFSFPVTILYIIFFYFLSIAVSLVVNIVNNLINRSNWFYLLAGAITVLPFALLFIFGIDSGDFTQKAGRWVLHYNIFIWIALFALLLILWLVNRIQMRNELYHELQGEKLDKIVSFSSLSFLDRLGGVGEFINLELKMIFRSKRLKSQLFAAAFFICYFFWQIYSSRSIFAHSFFMLIFWSMFTMGSLGLIMGQYAFMAESSFFDGLMSRRLSIFDMLKSKYILYSFYAFVVALLMLIPVFSGKLSILVLLSVFFFITGPIFFLIFQNAVYNKSYFDLFDGGMMNWKGTSSNMLIITIITMFIPMIIVSIVNSLWGSDAACWFMLLVGFGFTVTSKYWLRWTYQRFLRRKYKNMEGFRSNA